VVRRVLEELRRLLQHVLVLTIRFIIQHRLDVELRGALARCGHIIGAHHPGLGRVVNGRQGLMLVGEVLVELVRFVDEVGGDPIVGLVIGGADGRVFAILH
jgi:hypothetical protein